MMNRQKTVDPFRTETVKESAEDILSDLSGNKTINTASNKAIKQYKKTKATFNLHNETLQQLDEVWMALRNDSSLGRITKTNIVESSLELLLEEFKSQGRSSRLYQVLKAIKQ